MTIIENKIFFFNTIRELQLQNIKILKHLSMLLQMSVKDYPKPKAHLTDCKELAYYQHWDNTVHYNVNKYKSKELSEYASQFNIDIDDYKYAIPIAVMYHELIHYFQFWFGNYESTPLLEGTNGLIVAILIDPTFIAYERESVGVWFLLRRIIQLDLNELYVALRSCIVNMKDFENNYLLFNERVIKYSKNKKMNYNKLITENINDEFINIMVQELNQIHKSLYSL